MCSWRRSSQVFASSFSDTLLARVYIKLLYSQRSRNPKVNFMYLSLLKTKGMLDILGMVDLETLISLSYT